MVVNATTHTKSLVDLSMFGKVIDTTCAVNELSWIDENNNEQKVSCFFENGTSKGLFVLAKELNIIPNNMLSKNISLPGLRILAF